MAFGKIFRLMYEKIPNRMLINFVKTMPYETKRAVAQQHPNHEVRLTYLRALGVTIGSDTHINHNFTIIIGNEGDEQKLFIGKRIHIYVNT